MVTISMVTRGNSDTVLALMKTIITHATMMHKQNKGFALVLAHSDTIICPTTASVHALLSLLSTKEQTLRNK